jgi:hypothetical protein
MAIGRPKRIERKFAVKTYLSEKALGEISLLLWSDAHGRIPHGELTKFFEEAIQEKLSRIRARLDEAHGLGYASEDKSLATAGDSGDDH